MEIQERPVGYVGPNLDPGGVRFRTRRLGSSVYAILARPMPRDNSGLIVGDDAALMIDAGINGDVARRLQRIAARLTDKPLRYLVNTNYHGDHTFGNFAFPPSVEIIAHRLTAEAMNDLAAEKRIRSGNLKGHEAAIADVTVWRRPDRVFDDRLDVDLGGRVVQLWHFGSGNTPGDHHSLRAGNPDRVDRKFPRQQAHPAHVAGSGAASIHRDGHEVQNDAGRATDRTGPWADGEGRRRGPAHPLSLHPARGRRRSQGGGA
ncbi:MBL fold metallo-hydrolase [Bradyrhizobium diazoefficiens]|nr:MBL fold metallo-hydrolase [Bradyrhizobium diazoefficiens]